VTPGPVAFPSSLVTSDAFPTSQLIGRPSVWIRDEAAIQAAYCPDDYDNVACDNDNDNDEVNIQTEVSLPSAMQPADLILNNELSQTSTQTKSTTICRTTIRSSEEESLDNLVAHLLGEGTPTSPVVSGQSTTSSGHPSSSSGPETSSSSLRWPQGDSLPRVEMRRTGGDRDASLSGKSMRDVFPADENDNIVKNVTIQRVIYDLPGSEVSAPASPPPLITFRKKTTTDTVLSCDDVEVSRDGRPALERVSNLDLVSGNIGAAVNDVKGHQCSVRFDDSVEHSDNEATSRFNLTAQQPSDADSLQNERRRPREDSDLHDTRDETELPSQPQSSLMDQFKALRLEVLTSTSELLSCVSGTWKRRESFRSKLMTIMQLCVTLRSSVGRLESFLQSALSTSAGSGTANPLVDAANTRIKNLHAVQVSIDAYIETLDGEKLTGSVNKQDLKVGGIIHLTKEIPGLVRTFAPVIEYLATELGPTDLPHRSVSRGTEFLLPQTPALMNLDCESQEEKEEQTMNIPDNAQLDSTQKTADVSPAIQSDRHGQRTSSDVRVHSKAISTNGGNNISVISELAQTTHEQRPLPTISNIVTTMPTTASLDIAPVFPRSGAESDLTVTDSETKFVNHVGTDSGRGSEVVVPPVLPVKLDTTAPPTPPPKTRVTSNYDACLGISNTLTASPSAPVTASSLTSTSSSLERDGERVIAATTSNSAVQLSAEESKTRRETVSSSDDKFQPTDWQTGDRVGVSCEVRTSDINDVSGCADEVVISAADSTPFRFPRAADTEESVVVLRRPVADPDVDARRCHVSESELETPDFRASGVSQTTVDQLEALQRQANAQAVVMHTDSTAGYDRFDVAVSRPPNPHYQSTLGDEDRRLLMFYCDQMTGHWNVLDNAASAFFHCMDRRQPPKVFVSHSKFVIVAGHKMAYLGDVLARNIDDDNAQDWIVAHSNRLCNSLKMTVRATKEAALAYPAVAAQQLMVDCIKEVTDWAIELKEVVDRLAYLGRPDHVLA